MRAVAWPAATKPVVRTAYCFLCAVTAHERRLHQAIATEDVADSPLKMSGSKRATGRLDVGPQLQAMAQLARAVVEADRDVRGPRPDWRDSRPARRDSSLSQHYNPVGVRLYQLCRYRAYVVMHSYHDVLIRRLFSSFQARDPSFQRDYVKPCAGGRGALLDAARAGESPMGKRVCDIWQAGSAFGEHTATPPPITPNR
jgi:hypothetical protein